MTFKLGRMVAHLDGLLPIKSHTATVPTVMKHGRMVTYREGLLTSKSCNALITWPYKVT